VRDCESWSVIRKSPRMSARDCSPSWRTRCGFSHYAALDRKLTFRNGITAPTSIRGFCLTSATNLKAREKLKFFVRTIDQFTWRADFAWRLLRRHQGGRLLAAQVSCQKKEMILGPDPSSDGGVLEEVSGSPNLFRTCRLCIAGRTLRS